MIYQEEYIRKIESYVLFPLSDKERIDAVRLARQYTGRIVVNEWAAWTCMGNSGFSRFTQELPGIIRCEEKSRIESEKKATPQSTFEAELPGLVDDPFSGFWSRFGKGKKSAEIPGHSGVCLEQESSTKEQVPVHEPEIGYMDPEEGWLIDGMPVF